MGVDNAEVLNEDQNRLIDDIIAQVNRQEQEQEQDNGSITHHVDSSSRVFPLKDLFWVAGLFRTTHHSTLNQVEEM